MSNKPKALMTQYAEGCLVARELQDMLVNYAADARFDREMVDDVYTRNDGEPWGKYSHSIHTKE